MKQNRVKKGKKTMGGFQCTHTNTNKHMVHFMQFLGI